MLKYQRMKENLYKNYQQIRIIKDKVECIIYNDEIKHYLKFVIKLIFLKVKIYSFYKIFNLSQEIMMILKILFKSNKNLLI